MVLCPSCKYHYTTFTNFSMKYHLMCKVYTDVGGIKWLYHVCQLVRKIIHSLKLVGYLHVQADNPWNNYYLLLISIGYSSFCVVYGIYLRGSGAPEYIFHNKHKTLNNLFSP